MYMVKTSQRVLQYELPLDIKRDVSGGFVATCPAWSACFAQGETVDEAVLEITAVAQSLIELYTEEGLSIPLKSEKERSILGQSFMVPVFVSV